MDKRGPITGPLTGPVPGPPLPPWWLAAGWAAVLAATAWAGWRGGFFQGQSLSLLYFICLGALLNVTLLALLLWLWVGLGSRRERCFSYNQELRYLRSWAGEEGRLRKQGLIRELNALWAVPDDLEQAVLDGADLAGANLRGCNLRNADLRKANLQGAVLDGADLWGAYLSGAKLTMASLKFANLRGCNLEGAEIVKAQLTGADFRRANVFNANLHGSDLTRVRLEHARFGAREEGSFQQTVHSSVEDWIRERVDEKGYYSIDPAESGAPRQNPVDEDDSGEKGRVSSAS